MSTQPRAFTLIETMVAVSIISIAVVGPLVTASRAILAANIARDQLTAAYLAQEGVEYARLMRDGMYLADYKAYPSDPTLSNDAFCDFYDANPSSDCLSHTDGSGPAITPPAGAAGYSISTAVANCLGTGNGATACQLNNPLATIDNNNSLTVCSGGNCLPLYFDGSKYTTSASGTLTPFTRTIQFYGCPPLSSGGTPSCSPANTLVSEIEVVVTVSWQEHGQPYHTSLTDYLSPWQ